MDEDFPALSSVQNKNIDDLHHACLRATDENQRNIIKGEIWNETVKIAEHFWQTGQNQEVFTGSEDPYTHRMAREMNEHMWGELPRILIHCMDEFKEGKKAKFSTYLISLIKKMPNNARRYVSAELRKTDMGPHLEINADTDDEHSGFLADKKPANRSVEQAELAEKIAKALRPFIFVDAENMSYFLATKIKGISTADIAEKVQIPERTIRHKIGQFTKKIHEALTPLHQINVIHANDADEKLFANAFYDALKKLYSEGQSIKAEHIRR